MSPRTPREELAAPSVPRPDPRDKIFPLEVMGKLWSITLPWGWSVDGMRWAQDPEHRLPRLLKPQNKVDARCWAGKIAGKIAGKVNRKFIQIIPTANCLWK